MFASPRVYKVTLLQYQVGKTFLLPLSCSLPYPKQLLLSRGESKQKREKQLTACLFSEAFLSKCQIEAELCDLKGCKNK